MMHGMSRLHQSAVGLATGFVAGVLYIATSCNGIVAPVVASPDAGTCWCAEPTFPGPFTFTDTAPHTIFTMTVPIGSSATVRTGVTGHIVGDDGVLVAVVAYETWWGFLNVSGTVTVASVQGSGGWGYASEDAVGTLTTDVTGDVVAFQVTNADVVAWTPATYLAAFPVTSGGATYQTTNGGVSTVAPTGAGGTGSDGVTWVRVAATTTLTRTWQVTDNHVELAGAP